MVQPKSLSRGEVTELTHIAPIKQGLVPNVERPVSYADRLRLILKAFQQREDAHFPSVIRIFRGIHFAKWALIDGDNRLLLNVTFDGGWYDYLRALAYDVPGFLHLIWSNCVGWEPVDHNPEALFRFIRRYQAQAEFFYAHNYELTARDVESAQKLRVRVEERIDSAKQEPRGCFCWSDYAEFLKEQSPKPREEVLTAEIDEWSKVAVRAMQASGDPVGAEDLVRRVKLAFTELLRPLYEEKEVMDAYREAFGEEGYYLAYGDEHYRRAFEKEPGKGWAAERDKEQRWLEEAKQRLLEQAEGADHG